GPVFAGQLAEPVAGGRRTRLHRLVLQVALHVPGQPVGRLVAPRPVLLPRLHGDPVPLPPQHPAQFPPPRPPPGTGGSPPPPRAEMVANASPDRLKRVLGLGGSSSRMVRNSSSSAVCFSRSCSSGVLPVSSSYSSTPSA